MEDQLKSNFISYLKTEKMNNRTLDFKKVFADLEPLAYSHALILLNKRQLVKQLLRHLKPIRDGRKLEGALATSDSVIKGKILELFIALIKDLRQDPTSSAGYFKLMEENDELKKLFRQMDTTIKSAINFLSQAEMLVQPTIIAYRQMLVKMLEF